MYGQKRNRKPESPDGKMFKGEDLTMLCGVPCPYNRNRKAKT